MGQALQDFSNDRAADAESACKRVLLQGGARGYLMADNGCVDRVVNALIRLAIAFEKLLGFAFDPGSSYCIAPFNHRILRPATIGFRTVMVSASV